MAGYFIGMHIYVRMRKSLLVTFSSAELNNIALNSKKSKLVSYIQDNKYWERIYVLLKMRFLCIKVLSIADSKKKVWTRFSDILE